MASRPAAPTAVPICALSVSVIIPVRDRWGEIGETLRSLKVQSRAPAEVILVDDGSRQPAPEDLRGLMAPVPLRVIRQPPLGIPAARNAGLRTAAGDLVLFTDSDCVLKPDCLQRLMEAAAAYTDDAGFQLAFAPEGERAVHAIDGLVKRSKQDALITPTGHVRYVDTGGFAIRQDFARNAGELFPVRDVRGSDTGALCQLIAEGQLPRLVQKAEIEHRPNLPLMKYVTRHFLTAYRSGPAWQRMREASLPLEHRDRLGLVRVVWGRARDWRMGVLAVVVMLLSKSFEMLGRVGYLAVGMRPGRIEVFGIPIDCVRSEELQWRIVTSAQDRQGSALTYLTAWSLVQAELNPEFKENLKRFDVIYADGMGVVMTAALLRARSLRKVTANDFFEPLCEGLVARSLGVAFIGATDEVCKAAVENLRVAHPNLRVVFSHCGFFEDGGADVIQTLEEAAPDLVVLGMGQPLQEEFALRIRREYPEMTVLCAGGLFEVISGALPTPPRLVRAWGFEWLFRLVDTPGRVWKRYVLGLPMLGLLILREYPRMVWRSVRKQAALREKRSG